MHKSILSIIIGLLFLAGTLQGYAYEGMGGRYCVVNATKSHILSLENSSNFSMSSITLGPGGQCNLNTNNLQKNTYSYKCRISGTGISKGMAASMDVVVYGAAPQIFMGLTYVDPIASVSNTALGGQPVIRASPQVATHTLQYPNKRADTCLSHSSISTEDGSGRGTYISCIRDC